MHAIKVAIALTALFLVADVSAQGGKAKAKGNAPKTNVPEPRLNFDREVFQYPGDLRKDPMSPLAGMDAIGPLFEDLKLKGIIYVVQNPRMSTVTVTDGGRHAYSLRLGDAVGNAKLVRVERDKVIFEVMSYGVPRLEEMELVKRETYEQKRAREAAAASESLGKLFGEQLLRALTDTARRATPGPTTTTPRPTTPPRPGAVPPRTPPRPDTTTADPRPGTTN